MLGGRALHYELYPLIYKEIPDFNLIRALNHGLLPRHYVSKNPKKLNAAYVGSYLHDEIYVHSKYSGLEYPISYWRTTSQIEIDFVLGNNEVGIEVKASKLATNRHLKGLKQFSDEYRVKKLILVSNDPRPRKIDDIFILPWKIFLDKLWAGEIIH